jgi:hypothetical protein
MKIRNYFSAAAALVIGAGCQSNHDHASNAFREMGQGSQPAYTYTIVSIPAERLTPTSREGDKSSGPIYSSNIIAVYAHRTGDTNADDVGGSEKK